MRMCSICRTQKEEAEFRMMKKRNRRNSYCKDCERWYMRNYMRAYRDIKLSAHPLFYCLSGFCSRDFFTRSLVRPCTVYPICQINDIVDVRQTGTPGRMVLHYLSIGTSAAGLTGCAYTRAMPAIFTQSRSCESGTGMRCCVISIIPVSYTHLLPHFL